MGKGAFNEKIHIIWVFTMGKLPKIKYDYVDNSDLILNIGAKLTDSATAGFSYQFNIDDVVMLNHHNIKIDDLQMTKYLYHRC